MYSIATTHFLQKTCENKRIIREAWYHTDLSSVVALNAEKSIAEEMFVHISEWRNDSSCFLLRYSTFTSPCGAKKFSDCVRVRNIHKPRRRGSVLQIATTQRKGKTSRGGESGRTCNDYNFSVILLTVSHQRLYR